MRDPVDLTARFRAAGRKVTPQREAVFRALAGNHVHPTAEAVHVAVTAELPMVSLRTVYQVLHDLAELDEIQVLDLGTGATRFDPNVEPHHHLVCSACGAVRDVPVPDGEPGPPDSADFPGSAGFRVARVEVIFRGTCARCPS